MISFQQINPGQLSRNSDGVAEIEFSERSEWLIICLGSEIGRMIGGVHDGVFVVYGLEIPQPRHWVLLDAILEQLIFRLKAQSIERIVLYFFADESCSKQTWEETLRKYAFSDPLPWSHSFIVSPSLFAPRWLSLRLGKEFQIRPWGDVEELVDRSIKSGCLNGNRIPEDQLPVKDGRYIDNQVSQGLLFGGKLAGWIHAWRDEQNGNRMVIRILYVDTPLQARGVGIRFLATFLESFPLDTRYHFCVLDQNRHMLNFVTKHMGKSMIRSRVRYCSTAKC